MTGRHRRGTSKIKVAVMGMILLAAALFLILGPLWIYMDRT
jgi:hypothetical protein